MRSLHTLLDAAERQWRNEVNAAHPVWGDMKVERAGTATPGRDWEFSTDLKKIHALINNDERLQTKFESIVSKYWPGEPEAIAYDVLHYLLFHELYHPLEAPFSVSGEHNDNKKIHQAIRRGVLKAEPTLKPLEQLMKVQASQNGIKDFILDNRFALDNAQQHYVRDDIIPVWDVLELEGQPVKTNFYTITRFLYGALYGPQSTHGFFAEKADEKGMRAAKQALDTLLQEPTTLPAPTVGLLKKAKALFTTETVAFDPTAYRQKIRAIFAGTDRYAGIERLMSVLGPYVEKDMLQGRADQQGEGSGASPQNILQDLLEDMTPQEQQEFLSSVVQETGENDDRKPFGMGTANSVQEWDISSEERNTLELSAMHEFYKHNHPKVSIVGGQKVGESIVVGKRERFALTKSSVISEEQLTKLNLAHIARFQQKTRLPVLVPLENGQYRLNEYTLRSHDIKDIRYVDAQLNVPEEVKLYADSSGSMYHDCSNLGFNDGSSWDMLSGVVYGLVDGLYQAGRKLHQSTNLQIFNFADEQVASRALSVEEFMQGAPDVLQAFFKPKNGYSVENLDIQPGKNGKTTYIIVTDGNLVIGGRTERESRKMKELAKNPDNTVVLFEIGGTYDLGRAVKDDPNIYYYSVSNKEQMLQNGLEVLLSRRTQHYASDALGGHS